MPYHLPCPCGEFVTVDEGSAGAQVQCVCGRTIDVPSLRGLRELAGEPAPQPSPELVIEQMLLAGMLPPDRRCVHCGVETDQRITVQVECERAWMHKRGYGAELILWVLFSWWAALVALLFRDRDVHEFGRDKIYALPVPICSKCRPMLSDDASVRTALKRVPEYRRLLEKFPDAKMEVLANVG